METKSVQHKHMLPVCVGQTASASNSCSTMFIFHFEPRRHFIIHLYQYELSRILTLGAPGIMIAAARQLSEHVGWDGFVLIGTGYYTLLCPGL